MGARLGACHGLARFGACHGLARLGAGHGLARLGACHDTRLRLAGVGYRLRRYATPFGLSLCDTALLPVAMCSTGKRRADRASRPDCAHTHPALIRTIRRNPA